LEEGMGKGLFGRNKYTQAVFFEFVFPAALDEFLSQVLFESCLLSAFFEFLFNEALLQSDVSVVLRTTEKVNQLLFLGN
jgi:hypothetical protein